MESLLRNNAGSITQNLPLLGTPESRSPEAAQRSPESLPGGDFGGKNTSASPPQTENGRVNQQDYDMTSSELDLPNGATSNNILEFSGSNIPVYPASTSPNAPIRGSMDDSSIYGGLGKCSPEKAESIFSTPNVRFSSYYSLIRL
jgi:hypothetical protein